MPNFEPLHEGHAIEQMTLTIQMDRPIDTASISAVRKALGNLPELPRRQDLREVTLALGASVPSPHPSQITSTSGVSFAKINEDGTVETELRLERSGISYHTTHYTSWQIIWPRAFGHIKTVLPLYLSKVSLSGLALVYIDKFVWNGPGLEDADPTQMLRQGSPFLPPHIFKRKDLWHSHTGAFERIDSTTKRLINVNLDFVDQPKDDRTDRTIVITTVLNDLLNQPDYGRLENQPSLPDFWIRQIDDRLNRLHDDSKNVLAEIISENMSHRIALKP